MASTTQPRRPGGRISHDVPPADHGGAVRAAARHVRRDPVVARSSPTRCPGSSPTWTAAESAYTWVVTATLLAMTATTPLWGKLADLFSKKLLVQMSLTIYVLGSALAGLSQNAGHAHRLPGRPGHRRRRSVRPRPDRHGRDDLARGSAAGTCGYLGAVFAVATVGGPLLGGVIIDTSWLGWRWCFYVGVPFAVVALVRAAADPAPAGREAPGQGRLASAPFFVTAAVSLLLIWVTLRR